MTPQLRPLKERALMAGEQARRRRVVSGGGGFASFQAARALSRPTMDLDREVVLINPTDYFLSTALGRTIRYGVPARQPCRGERDGPARVRAGEETLLRGDPYVDVPVQATRAARRARGVFEQLRGSAEALAAGEVAQVTDMVARLTVGPLRTFAELAHDLVAAA